MATKIMVKGLAAPLAAEKAAEKKAETAAMNWLAAGALTGATQGIRRMEARVAYNTATEKYEAAQKELEDARLEVDAVIASGRRMRA